MNRPVIKPVHKWARELGITCATLKKWLAVECGLTFNTSRKDRISLVEECYVQRVLDKRLAKPIRAYRPRPARGIALPAVQSRAPVAGNATAEQFSPLPRPERRGIAPEAK